MVTSGLFQIKGSVKVKDSVLYPDYFKPKSYWENGEIVYNRESKGYISFGTKYLSYRVYPNDEATLIPYENIRKIQLEGEIRAISDSKFLWNLESNQNVNSLGNRGIKSIVTTKNVRYNPNFQKAISQKFFKGYLFFGYEYLTVKTLSQYSPSNILLSESKFRYSDIKSVEFEDETINDNEMYRIYLSQLHKLKHERKNRLELEIKENEGESERNLNSKNNAYREYISKKYGFSSKFTFRQNPSSPTCRHDHYCSFCKKIFKTKEDLDKHINKLHMK